MKRRRKTKILGLRMVQWRISDGKRRVCATSNKSALFVGLISLFCLDSHQCLTFKYSITCEMSLLRILYIEKTAVRQ